jgi:hypothetical protein
MLQQAACYNLEVQQFGDRLEIPKWIGLSTLECLRCPIPGALPQVGYEAAPLAL